MSSVHDPTHIAWCRRQFAFLAEGGIWAVPRSGVVFTKRNGRLVWTAAMPWMAEMEGRITPEQLAEQQADEYATVREHFAAAGIEVVRAETISDEVFGGTDDEKANE